MYFHILFYDIKYSNNLSKAFTCLEKGSSWGLTSPLLKPHCVNNCILETILTQT